MCNQIKDMKYFCLIPKISSCKHPSLFLSGKKCRNWAIRFCVFGFPLFSFPWQLVSAAKCPKARSIAAFFIRSNFLLPRKTSKLWRIGHLWL